jgi:hypothetical protein
MRTKITVIFASLAALLLTAGGAIAGPAVTAAPEPVSLSLLVVGVGGLALARRFRRK